MQRVVVISDLHIGGRDHPMLGHPEVLTDFLGQLAAHPGRADLELVVAGDFIDFLAEGLHEAWSTTEGAALEKLEAVFARNVELFDAFARCGVGLARSTVLLGNHDVELAYPRVRDALFRRLHTGPHRCCFIHSNDAYRVGDMLIEHGNRYDAWNAIDHDGLRQIVSCAPRGEEPPRALEVCPGSQLVYGAMNPLKARYGFLDLLKPEGKVHALLMLEMEPTIVKKSLPELFRFAEAWVARNYRKAQWLVSGDGISPTTQRLVAAEAEDDLPLDIRRAFYKELADIEAQQQRNVSVGDGLDMVKTSLFGKHEDGLKAMFARGEAIPAARLRKLQVALRGVLDGDKTFEEGLPDGNCHAAAKKMVAAGVAKVVVMGHTHLARDINLGGGGRYLNTGTWADLIRIDKALLTDTDEAREALEGWLHEVAENRLEGIREHRPRYADVEVEDDGKVRSARLGRFAAGDQFA
jgi:UDP-2,3-diacylglucosamine pyrophosphatase LpxH